MVNRSYLCHVSGGAAPIAWSRIPQASKNEAKRFHKRDASPAEQTLPPTVGALAEMLDESTFFGYMTEELCTLHMDISEFGLEAKASVFGGTTKLCTRTPGPHIYMKYIDRVQFVLFSPGDRACVTGGRDVVRMEDVEAERALAVEYDAQLEQALEGGEKLFVCHRLAGWQAEEVKSILQFIQYTKAILNLPLDHPVKRLLRSIYPELK